MARLAERDTDRYLKFQSETTADVGPGSYINNFSSFSKPQNNRPKCRTKKSVGVEELIKEGQNKAPFN